MNGKIFSMIASSTMMLASACTAAVPLTATDVPATATNTITPSSTATPTPSPTPDPTKTPKPTSTPRPVAVIVTARPAGQSNSTRITGPVGIDYKSLNIPQTLWFERVAWVADVQFNYGGGTVLLSGSPNGVKPLMVDDVLTLKILHENGRFDSFEYDFSAHSTGSGPQEAGPFDLTQFFREGVNMLYVTIYDYGYSYWGTQGLWLVEFK